MRFAAIGGQNGDEGKGKVVEYLISLLEQDLKKDQKIITARFQGGGNAGHTVPHGSVLYKLHQIPSGILRVSTYNLLGTGMFVNPRTLVTEIEDLRTKGIDVSNSNLGVSSKAHVTLDYHLKEDEQHFKKKHHTSTGKGIKQTARDKADRVGLRFVEFLDRDLTIEVLRRKFPSGMPENMGSYEQFSDSYAREREFLKEFVVLETDMLTNEKLYPHMIEEGAQGFMLGLDNGQYPGITSSNPDMPRQRPDSVLGVFKAYVSSVGTGDRPFVSAMADDLQHSVVKAWSEFGTTTGKARETGWFDLLQAKTAAQTARMDFLALSCLDRLETFAELDMKIKICTGYDIDGKEYNKWDASFDRRDTLRRAKPIYGIELEPWKQTIKDGTLTPEAEQYVRIIEEEVGVPVALIGIGPMHKDIIMRKDII